MTGIAGGSGDEQALFFDGPASFRAWLERHHDTATELWVELRRTVVPERGLTWKEAVQEALCFGWIDSRVVGIDEVKRRQRFTPRKKSSSWSAVNIALMQELQQQDRMTPAGLAVFEARDRTKNAIQYYERDPVVFDPVLGGQLVAHAAAKAFWDLAIPSYRSLATAWVMNAKQQATRESRMATLVDVCAAGRLIKSQRYGVEPAWVRRAREQLGITPADPPHDG